MQKEKTKAVILDTLIESVEPLTEELVKLIYPNLTDKASIQIKLTSMDHPSISTEIQAYIVDIHNEVITDLVDEILVFSLDRYDNLDCEVINGMNSSKKFDLNKFKHENVLDTSTYSLVGTLGFILRRINLTKGL